jgi:hypothetical protein
VDTCVYDYENFAAGTIPDASGTPYGALVLRTAVCAGYSSAFKMFMDMLGVPCEIISGTANGEYGGAHAWNRVELGGEFYLVDATWDDPLGNEGEGRAASHRYFNVTDETLARDHTPDEPYTPKCFATKYNYYYYNDLIVADQEELDAAIAEAATSREPELTRLCVGVSAAALDLEAVFVFAAGCSYSIDEGLNILTIYFRGYNDFRRVAVASQAEFDAAVAAAAAAGEPAVTLLCAGVSAADLNRRSVFRVSAAFSYSISERMNAITIYFTG